MNFWEYEDRKSYNTRQRMRFEQEARAAAFNQIAQNLLKVHGLDPATRYNRLPTSLERSPVDRNIINSIQPEFSPDEAEEFPKDRASLTSRPKKKKGLIGSIADAAGGIIDDVGLSDIEQPWDVLRPVKRAMDWEQREIAAPLAKRVLEPLPGELEHNGILVFLAETALSPSTWVGPGTIKAMGKAGLKIGGSVPALSQVMRGSSGRAGQAALKKAIAGASDENTAVTKMAQAFNGISIMDGVAKNVDEVVEGARSRRGFIDSFKGGLDNILPPKIKDFIEDFVGIDLADSQVVPFITHHQRILGMSMNYGNATADVARASFKKTLQVDSSGLYTMDKGLFDQAVAANIPGVEQHGFLPIDDLIRAVDGEYEEFGVAADAIKLTEAQRAAIETARGPISLIKEALRLSGNSKINPDDIKDFHRQIFEFPEVMTKRDPISFAAKDMEWRQRMQGNITKGAIGGREQILNPDATYRTMAEGLNDGIKYFPFAESQAAGVAQAFKLIADDWLQRSIQPYGATITSLLPPALMKEKATLDYNLGHAFNLKQRLEAAIQNPSKNRSWNLKQATADKLTPELQKLANDAGIASTLPKMADRKAMFEALRRQYDDLVEPMTTRKTELQKELARERVRIRNEGAQPSYIKNPDGTPMLDEAGKPMITRESLPVNINERMYPRAEGDDLNAYLRTRNAGTIEKRISAINNYARPLMATLDVSFMGIQGLIGFANNPIGYSRALKAVITRGYDDYVEQAMKGGHLDSFIKAGGYWSARNDFGEFVFPSAYKKIPGVGKATEMSNMAFSEFGNVMRMEMFRTGSKGISDPTKLSALAELVNKATGYTSTNPTSFETMGMFAPRFFRAQMGLLSDAITKRDMSGQGAARMLANMTAMGVAFTGAVNEGLIGADYDWMNPIRVNDDGSFDLNPDFMRIKTEGHNFSIFGPWDSLARIAIKAAADGPDDAGVYFLRSKASPVVSRIWDIAAGENFNGDPTADFSSPQSIIESFYHNAKSVLPISIQQAVQNGVPTNFEEGGAALAEFTGLKVNERNRWDSIYQARDRRAQQFANKDWDELEPWQRNELIETFGEELEGDGDLKADASYAWKTRNDVMERFTQKQELIDSKLTGADWRKAYQDLQKQKAAVLEQWEEEHPKEAQKLRSKKDKSPEEQALQDYYDLFAKSNDEVWTPEELGDNIDEFESNLSPSQLAYIERNTGLKGTPKVQEYRADSKVMKSYWEADEQVWERLKERGRVTDETFSDYVNKKEQALINQGVSPEAIPYMLSRDPIVKAISGAVGDIRKRMRARNRNLDRLLLKWGYIERPISGGFNTQQATTSPTSLFAPT